GSVLAPLLTRKLGPPRALTASLAVLLAGVLWIALNPATNFSASHAGAFTLVGTGLGLGVVNATAMAVRDSHDGEAGLLSGLVNSAQTLGGAMGLAALTGIALGVAGDDTPGGINFTATFLGGAGLVLIALLLSLLA